MLGSADGPSNIEKNIVAGKYTDRKKNRHPSSEEFAAFLDNKDSAEQHEFVIMHLAECVGCRKLIAHVVSSRKVVREPKKP